MIRSYVSPDDALPTLEVFTRALREMARFDDTNWDSRLAAADTRVFVLDGTIAGFALLGADGCLEMLFVHPEFTRRGIAVALLESFGDGPLCANASITTRGFFERHGFIVRSSRQDEVRGQVISTYRMSRD